MRAFYVLTVTAALVSSDIARAGFIDDDATFSLAISALRGAVGQHARVLRVAAEGNGIEIEVQDPHSLNHINRWRYGTVTYMGVPLRRLTGPEPVNPSLINPDIEANLFDLDSINFGAAPKLVADSITRAHLQDAAAVTNMEIARQVFILPAPTSGEVRWTVHVDSGREQADIFSDAQGVIVSADVSGTQRAKTLNILKEPGLAGEAAATFRDAIGSDRILTEVGIDKKTVSFHTNISDKSLRMLGSNMPATATFLWDLNGLQRPLIPATPDINAAMGIPPRASFGIGDVDWTLLEKLEDSAVAKTAIPRSAVSHVMVAASTDQPGAPALVWTLEVTDPDGEVTKVVADTKGIVTRVILPESRRPKIDWREPAALAGAIARIGATFGQNVKIASIVADERQGHITIDDPANGGQASTFEFSSDGVVRASISFSLDSMGPRFSVADLAPLNQEKIAALEADALRKLASSRQVYLEGVTIGAHPFVSRAGAHAIEVRVRDIAEDSVRANYAWIVYDFGGRALDSSKF